jgi:hypothetical protein
MPTLTSRSASAIAVVSGALLWVATVAITGRREAWDASTYWAVTYPIGLLVSAVLGYVAPDRPWRWGVALMLAQAVTMAVFARDFGLLPLGVILFCILAAPLMLAATGVARFRLRRSAE